MTKLTDKQKLRLIQILIDRGYAANQLFDIIEAVEQHKESLRE